MTTTSAPQHILNLLAADLLHKLDNDEAAVYAWTGGGD